MDQVTGQRGKEPISQPVRQLNSPFDDQGPPPLQPKHWRGRRILNPRLQVLQCRLGSLQRESALFCFLSVVQVDVSTSSVTDAALAAEDSAKRNSFFASFIFCAHSSPFPAGNQHGRSKRRGRGFTGRVTDRGRRESEQRGGPTDRTTRRSDGELLTVPQHGRGQDTAKGRNRTPLSNASPPGLQTPGVFHDPQQPRLARASCTWRCSPDKREVSCMNPSLHLSDYVRCRDNVNFGKKINFKLFKTVIPRLSNCLFSQLNTKKAP